jgi:hypothetical protein
MVMQYKNPVYAQNAFQFGGLPSLNLNSKLKHAWSFNTKIESRQLFQQRELAGEAVARKYEYVLTDFSFIAAKKVGLNSRIAGGYLIRFEDDAILHRFIQQYVVVQKLSGFRLAHRFLSDQTFSQRENPDFRIRYRVSSEIPLNGESVDPGEFYLKINHEYINSLQANEYDLEIRLVPLLGYDLSNRYKLEVGLDYRVSSFLRNETSHRYWAALNFFVEI